MGALAGGAGGSAGVGEGSKLSTSVFQPAEHVGEHQAGGWGWRAWGGSGGMAGGAGLGAGGGAEAGVVRGPCAQAVASSTSKVTVAARAVELRLGGLGGLGMRLTPLLLDVAGALAGGQGFGGEAGALGLALGALGGQGGAQLGGGALVRQAVAPAVGGQGQGADGGGTGGGGESAV